MSDRDIEWARDGHYLWLMLEKSELVISGVQCPNEGKQGSCIHPRQGCMVKYFTQLYGLECNVGSCEPAPYVEFAWAMMGDRVDLDMGQLWVIPVTDPLFTSFLLG